MGKSVARKHKVLWRRPAGESGEVTNAREKKRTGSKGGGVRGRNSAWKVKRSDHTLKQRGMEVEKKGSSRATESADSIQSGAGVSSPDDTTRGSEQQEGAPLTLAITVARR